MALIYLAPGSLRGSCDLTRSDTDVFTVGAGHPRIRTYLVLLRVEIAAFHPWRNSARTRLCGSRSPLPTAKDEDAFGHALGMDKSIILVFQRAAVSRYATLWSPDFPL